MNCRGVSRRLSAYIDNDLSPGIRDAVEEHLNSCILCKRRLTELETIVNAARNLVPLSVSEGFAQRVMTLVFAQHNSREAVVFLRNKIALASVGFMVAAAAIFLILGPSSRKISSSTYSAQEGPSVGFPGIPDFYAHPETKLYSFPIPENAMTDQLSREDSSSTTDSTSRIDQFVFPDAQNVKQNVNMNYQGK